MAEKLGFQFEFNPIFYQTEEKKRDLITVAFGEISFASVECPESRSAIALGEKSTPEGHAEINFIKELLRFKDVSNIFQKSVLPGPDIKVTINLSKSPCFMCREDLEDFLESLTKQGATATFTLRIANLYFGDGGGEDENIEDLASWLYHLKNKNIVRACHLEPFLVTNVIPDYRDSSVCHQDWQEILESRRWKDDKILHIVWKINQNILKLSADFAEIKTELGRQFYEIQAEAMYVAVAQVKMNAHNTVGRKKFKQFIVSKLDDANRTCCATIKSIKEAIDSKVKKPESWKELNITITLSVRHFPCDDCLARITSNLCEVKPTLVLRVANVPIHVANDNQEAIVDQLFKLHQKVLIVKLQPIRVIEEAVGPVKYKTDASQEEKIQWRDAIQQRRRLDDEALENVRQINDKLEKRIEIYKKILFDEAVFQD